MTQIDSTCSLCGSAYVRIWEIHDWRWGTGDLFHMGECRNCPALILIDPPADPADYYPTDYPSFTSAHRPRWRAPMRRLRNRLLLGRRGPVPRLVSRLRPNAASRFLDRTGTSPAARVLDVGSGAGGLLDDLADAGFKNLMGVDRFIPTTVDGPRFRVVKGTLADIDGPFDLVMFHHSLEHMRDQRGALESVKRVLAPGGWCVIRMPVFPSAAWDAYHEFWFQLDVPRHEYIYSVASLTRLAEETGLKFEDVAYDSTGHQFAGSEGYRMGLRLEASGTYFSPAKYREWAKMTSELNASGRGDQAIFYFRA